MSDPREPNDDKDFTITRSNDSTCEVDRIDGAEFVSDSGETLRRGLKARHISMIAIGGAIGTGLIIGTGASLATAGPAPLFISYCLVGFNVYIMMTAVGEMTTFIPQPIGFAGYATRFVDPAFGFTLGWNYLIKYFLTAPNQLTAAALVLQEWVPREKLNPGVWITLFTVCMLAINYAGVGIFGEIEFWLSTVKVVTFLGLIILSLVLALGGGPNHDQTGFRYWNNPGAFASYKGIEGDTGKFVAFVSIMINAAFAFMGTELVGVTAGEALNPSRTIPRAIKLTFWRIVLFYCVSVLLLGMIVPYNSPDLAFANNASVGAGASPFVVAIKLAGIPVLPAIVNAAILLFVLSTANTDIYIVSRTLYGMARTKQAPAIFGYANSRKVPVYGLAVAGLGCCLGFLNVSDDSRTVFLYFVNVVTIFGMLSWICILITHICFLRARKAQGIRNEDMAYTAPLGLWGSCFALAFFLLICIIKNFTAFINGFNLRTFITGYIGIPIFLITFVVYKFVKKTKMWKPKEIDLDTGRFDILEGERSSRMSSAPAENGDSGIKQVWATIYRRFLQWVF